MRAVGIILIVLALIIGIVPQVTDCLSQGKSLTLADGRTVPMKCHWTAQAELGAAVPLLVLGGMMIPRRRKESRRMLAILGIVLGLFVILFPTSLIGVCTSDMMICNSIMKPTLIFTGTLVVATSLVSLVLNWKEQAVPVLHSPGQAV